MINNQWWSWLSKLRWYLKCSLSTSIEFATWWSDFFTQLPVPPTHIHVLAWLLSPKLHFVFGTKIGCCGNAKVPVLPRSIKICCPDQQLQFLWLGRKERVWPVSVQVRNLQTGTIKEKQRGEKREYFQTRSREGPSGGTSWKHCRVVGEHDFYLSDSWSSSSITEKQSIYICTNIQHSKMQKYANFSFFWSVHHSKDVCTRTMPC